MRSLLPCVLTLLAATGTEAQAWTKRKGRSNKIIDQEDADEPDPSVYGNFAAMNEMASKPASKSRRRKSASAGGGMEDLLSQMAGGNMAEMMGQMGLGSGDMSELMKGLGDLGDMDMGSLMQQGMGMWKEMLDSPEMQGMLSDPDQMREMMMPFVEAMGGDKDKLEEVLADPEKLKSSMAEGIETMSNLFSDPSKLEEMAAQLMEGLDPSTKAAVERLASGDETVLTEMLAEIDPDGSLKEMMADFSDPAKLSDPAFLAQIQEKLLGNGDMKEMAEKYLAENPDLASAFAGSGMNLGELGNQQRL